MSGLDKGPIINGWKVYCRFSNEFGAVNTEKASIKVSVNGEGAPKVTKSPTGETVQVGGAADFVARHENALFARWHFVSPDGTSDILYTDAAAKFPGMQITGGDQGTLHLKNIPAEMNGWKVYCSFSNNIGTANTQAAAITIAGMQTANQGSTAATTSIYTGTYVDDRASMEISGAPGNYTVRVHWGSGAMYSADWVFSGNFDEHGILRYSNAKYTNTDYSTNTVTVLYENGTGQLVYSSNGFPGIYWTDDLSKDQINDKFFTKQ